MGESSSNAAIEVVWLGDEPSGGSSVRGPNRIADARLIAAAAPELLEALEILLVQFGEYQDGQGAAKYHAVNIARDALAQAKGGN